MEFVIIRSETGGDSVERYAGEVVEGRLGQVVGPLRACEGLGARAVEGLMRSADEHGSAAGDRTAGGGVAATSAALRLQALVDAGEAALELPPEVVRVRVGVTGDALDEGIDAMRLATVWVDRISAAFGIDDVCVACTVNLRGLPARAFSTSYWTADGVEHGRADGADETWQAITQCCWDAALADVRAAAPDAE